jgi:hypothetical protein
MRVPVRWHAQDLGVPKNLTNSHNRSTAAKRRKDFGGTSWS